MIKIFLVEDEVFALKTLHRKITDLNQDYEIVGTATDGTEALPKIQATHPAIVITDIRMSDMDGLTLIENMKKMHIDALPVIVSGYQEFEYAKQAMKLGVEDYLLKPVELSELDKCLRQCLMRLESRYLPKNIYSFLIGNEAFNLEPIISDGPLTLLYLIFSNPLNHTDTMFHPNTGYLPGEKVKEIFKKEVKAASIFCFDGIYSNKKVLLIPQTDHLKAKEDMYLEKILPILVQEFSFPVTIYYMESRAKSLTYDIRTARKCCTRNVIPGTSGYNHKLLEDPAPEDLSGMIELLSLLIRQEDYKLIYSNLLRLLKRWQTEKRPILSCQSELVFILNSLKRSFQVKKIAGLDSTFLVENILCFSSSPKELACDFTQLMADLTSGNKGSNESTISGEELVRRIDMYFQNHLSSSITLQMLADELNVSKVYLCRVFKKYKNVTPMDYFNRMKIHHACELIREFPSLQLAEISDKLGFNDVYYFSKVFKRITGIAPSSYRKENRNSD